MLMPHYEASTPMFLFGQEWRLWPLCLHKSHVTDVLPFLTFISLCKQVDLGRLLDTHFINSAGTIIGPTYDGHSYSLCIELNSGAQVLKYDCIA